MEDKKLLNEEELEKVNGGTGDILEQLHDNEQPETVDGEVYINVVEPAESFEITL